MAITVDLKKNKLTSRIYHLSEPRDLLSLTETQWNHGVLSMLLHMLTCKTQWSEDTVFVVYIRFQFHLLDWTMTCLYQFNVCWCCSDSVFLMQMVCAT